MLEHNVYSMDCLNRKAINTISSIHHLFNGMKSGSSKIVPLAKVGKVELTFKDFESLFWTYANYRKENELKSVSYSFVESSVKTSTFEIGADNVNIETIQICVGAEVSDDIFNVVDVPNEYKKRDGKSEKAKTEANKKKGNNSEPSEPTPTSEPSGVSPSDELDNEEKALKASVDKFNAEVDKDNAEILQNCVKSYTEMICKLFGDETDKETKKQVAKMLENFAISIATE